MDEFLSPAERECRATQFEKLRRAPGVSVSDYAREFIILSKYAPYMVSIEATKVKRFRAGLIMLLYNVLVAIEFSMLSKLVDTTKQLKARHREDQVEKEQRKLIMGKTHSKKEKAAMVGK